MTAPQRTFLNDLHVFRGFAILNIVVAHVFKSYFANLRIMSPLDHASDLLGGVGIIAWHDSTIYFALISGLLFSRVLAAQGWAKFFRGKLTNVMLPYAIMTFIFSLIWYEVFPPVSGLAWTYEGLMPFADRYLLNLVHGTAVYVYWYIPVLAFLFIATPLLYLLARRMPLTLACIALLPLVVSRTGAFLSVQSVIYFGGAYAVGIYLGIDYERSLAHLKKNVWVFVGAAVVSTAIIGTLFRIDWDAVGAVSLRESAFYIQKLSFSALILIFLDKWHDRMPKILMQVASYAFAIYFVHLFFVQIFIDASLAILPPPISAVQIFLTAMVIFVFVVALSVLIGIVSRAVFGRRARMIVGA